MTSENKENFFKLLKILKIRSSKYVKLSNKKIIVDGIDLTNKLFNKKTTKKLN